jgi:hypothetical protein
VPGNYCRRWDIAAVVYTLPFISHLQGLPRDVGPEVLVGLSPAAAGEAGQMAVGQAARATPSCMRCAVDAEAIIAALHPDVVGGLEVPDAAHWPNYSRFVVR